MNRKMFQPYWMVILFGILIASCARQQAQDPTVDLDRVVAEGVAATLTQEAAKQAFEEVEAEQAEAPAEEIASPTPEPEIVHEMVPEEPFEKANTYLTDFNSIDNANEGMTYGDQFLINRYERPFTREMVEYYGYLDLTLVNMMVNPPWVYLDIYLAEDLPESSQARYGVELDLDEDGRGDILLQAGLPGEGEWTTSQVFVYRDTDGDVGGENPLLSDPKDEGLTGYEELIFEEGRGEDPDLAWVRRHAEEENVLQIAFKTDLVSNSGFLWSVWADEGLRDVSIYDYNDWYTFEEAGSPFPDHDYHPIQEIYLVDSTCRSWYGYEPEGDEVGLCQVYVKEGGGGGGGKNGWKLCYEFRDGIVVCSDVCQQECPPRLPRNYFCRRCSLP